MAQTDIFAALALAIRLCLAFSAYFFIFKAFLRFKYRRRLICNFLQLYLTWSIPYLNSK